MKTVAFVSANGGVGRSTVIANLAATLAQRRKNVVVIDLDPQNSQRLHLGLDSEEIAGLCREGLSTASLFDSPFGVRFVPFGQASAADLAEFRADLAQDPGWTARRLSTLEPCGFDFAFIDTPAGGSVYLEQALRAASQAMLIAQADAASYAALPRINALIERHTAGRADFEGAVCLLNQMPSDRRLAHRVRQAVHQDKARDTVPLAIHRDPAVAQALAYERPVLEYAPGCMASLDYQYLADWLIASHSA